MGRCRSSSAVVYGDPAWAITHIGDLNGDGKADLLWLNAGAGQTAAWIMNGTTPASTALLLTDPNWRIERLADTDGDGNRDIVWRNAASGATALWRMNGTTVAGSENPPGQIPTGASRTAAISMATARPTSCGATRRREQQRYG